MQATIKDIAKVLGISPSTVSRALKDHPDISPKTKQKVKELAQQMHYRPNAIALSLKHSRSFTIGVVIPELVHHFFSSVISGISDVAYAKGYRVIITQSNESYERELRNSEALLSSMVDGLIVSVSKETKNYDHISSFIDNGVPVVLFDRNIDELPADKVLVDDVAGARHAVEHLLEQGCRRILHFAAPAHLSVGRNRLEGFKQALQNYNIEYDPTMVIQCDTFEEAMNITRSVFEQEPRPDGIFAVNDETAVGAMNALKRMGLSIPNDVAIVGFTNGVIAGMTEPQLSTVDQHGFKMGQQAAEMLFRRLSNRDEELEPQTNVIETKLIVRNSSTKQ